MTHRNDFTETAELTPLAFLAEVAMFVAVLGGLFSVVTVLHVALQ